MPNARKETQLPRLSRKDIEHISERVYAAYRKLPEIANKKILRISPELMLKLVGLKIEHCRLSQHGNIVGVTCSSGHLVRVFDFENEKVYFCLDGTTVLVDKELHDDESQRGRYNFTVMHELSHQVLRKLFPGEYDEVTYRTYHDCQLDWRRPISNWSEWQANTLASALLMPKDLIHQGMYYCGLEGRIEILNRKYRSREYAGFSNLADFLGVSKTALAIRMKYLGLIGENHLRYPDIMLEVVRDKEDDAIGR